LDDDSAPKKGEIVIFKVHDNERYDERVAGRAKKLIESNRGTKIGAMGTNAKLLAKHHAISLDFGVDVINKAISYASRGVDVILLASGNMAEYAERRYTRYVRTYSSLRQYEGRRDVVRSRRSTEALKSGRFATNNKGDTTASRLQCQR